MNSFGVIAVTVAALINFSGISCNPVEQEYEPNCDKYIIVEGAELACNRMIKPVCGTDYITYSNECNFCNAKMRKKADIRIKHDKACTLNEECSQYGPMCILVYQPMCGSDNKTYGNKCEFCSGFKMNANLSLKYHGECKTSKY